MKSYNKMRNHNKMKRYSKILILFALLVIGTNASATAAEESANTFEEQKIIEKTLVVDASHQLKINNRYGKVQLNNWDRNQIKVVVTIRTEESSRQRAKESLERVEIVHSTQGQVISFETKIGQKSESWWSNLTNTGRSSLSIDYEVHLPKFTGINIINRYSATIIPDRDGKVDLTVQYGSLKAKKLNADANRLRISYSSAEIQTLDEGSIDIKYGKLSLGAANNLELDMSYCSGSSIGQIHDTFSASLKYSSGFEVGLGKDIKRARIKASYSGIQVIPNTQAKLDFEVSVSYGQFQYANDRARISSLTERNRTSKSYTGTWNGGGNGSLAITSSYGKVTLSY